MLKKTGTDQVQVNGRLISEPFEIASEFNEFFTIMPSKIVNAIVQPSFPPPGPEVARPLDSPVFSFVNNPITQTEILDAVTQLQSKKSLDYNGISMFFLKKLSILLSFHYITVFRLL